MQATTYRRFHKGVDTVILDPILANPLLPCPLCYRKSRGAYYRHSKNHQYIPSCGTECLNGIMALCKVGGKLEMAVLTNMEKKAILDAKLPLFDALVRLGVAEAFKDVKPEHMDWLIFEVWEAIRKSMQQQSLQGEIPF